MAGPYAPQLTRWRVAMGGGARVRDFVEHHGNVISLRPEDYFHGSGSSSAAGDEDEDDDEEEDYDRRERVFLGGRLYPVADETSTVVPVGGGGGGRGRLMRCVEFCPEPGVAPLRLTVTTATGVEGNKKQGVAEIVDGGAVRALGTRGECYGEERSGTAEHVVEVEAFVLLVSVRHELARIVRVQRLN